jgi:N-acetylmuramoyl-L-alanine amidase
MGRTGHLAAPSAHKAQPPSHAGSTKPPNARPRANQAEFPVNAPPGPAGPLAPDTYVGLLAADPARAPTVFVDRGHGGVDAGTDGGATYSQYANVMAQPVEGSDRYPGM